MVEYSKGRTLENSESNGHFKRLNLKARLQHGVLNFKGGVSSRRSLLFGDAKVDQLRAD